MLKEVAALSQQINPEVDLKPILNNLGQILEMTLIKLRHQQHLIAEYDLNSH